MISVIICSKNAVTDDFLAENIASTIGTDYEIVHIDNSHNSYSIFQAYNRGVELAKGEYLCFMHEDVLFHSTGWGLVLIEYLSQKSTGLLGVAGCKLILDQSDWRFYDFIERPQYVIQGNSSVEPLPLYYIEHNGDYKKRPLQNGIEIVAVVDGVWMAIRKELFRHIRFDEENFDAFHLYDSDISMQVNMLGLDIMVTDRIVIEHKSEGLFSNDFLDGLKVFLDKWKESLPIAKGMSINGEDFSERLAVSKQNIDLRIALDTKKTVVRELLRKKKSEKCRDFTEEEKQIMDTSAFQARKGFVKNKKISSREVRKAILDYYRLPFSTHTIQLVLKYLWYRTFH